MDPDAGRMLTVAKFDKIKQCTIGDLHIQRTGERAYSMRIPVHGQAEHQQAKVQRWGPAILMNSPSL
jgi:predicted transcriptional regulator